MRGASAETFFVRISKLYMNYELVDKKKENT